MGEWRALKKASGTGWKELERESGTGWKAILTIDVGGACITRANDAGPGSTNLSIVNLANANGTLTQLCIYTSNAITGLHVGTFYQVSGNTWKCRAASGNLGNFAAGKHENIVINLAVQTNDAIAFYNATGEGIYWNSVPGCTYRYASGNRITADLETTFTLSGTDISFSCYAEG